MNNKIPPPIIGLCVALLIFLMNRYLPFMRLHSELLKLFALGLVVLGLVIELYSVVLFIKARTTVNPLKPANSKALVTGGLYRYSRNPMYFGMLILLLGWALWLGSLAGVPLVALFVWYITEFQIKPEEQALATLFGQQFADYSDNVRRWI